MKKIITILSYRGGTGKSTVVSNLASTLAEAGNKVIIMDTDIQSPGMNAMFGLDNNTVHTTLSDFLRGKAKIEQATLDVSDIVSLHKGKLLLVPASIQMGDLTERLSEKKRHNKIREAVEQLINVFSPDYILIDTHPGVNEEALLTAAFSDVVLNIVRPDNQDYQGAEVTIKLLEKLKTDNYLLINRVHRKINLSELDKQLKKKFKVPVAGYLPFSEDILFAESRYIFSKKYPHHSFSHEMQRIVANIFDEKPHEHLEVLHKLLSIVQKQEMSIEQIEKKAQMNKKMFEEHLNELLDEHFLNKKHNKLTLNKKGKDFMRNYGTVSKFVNEFRL